MAFKAFSWIRCFSFWGRAMTWLSLDAKSNSSKKKYPVCPSTMVPTRLSSYRARVTKDAAIASMKVAQGKMTMLDYFAERTEVWRMHDKFYGQPYIWCYLGNFGGNTVMHGNV